MNISVKGLMDQSLSPMIAIQSICFLEIIPKIKDKDREKIRRFVFENFSWDEEYKKLENLYLKI